MKKIIQLLLLLAFGAAFGFIGWQFASAAEQPTPTVQPSPKPTMTPTEAAQVCTVTTGITSGTVNLRACPGSMCGAVLDILTEGESLTIVTAGLYVNVKTEDGLTGWLNSKYCKGK